MQINPYLNFNGNCAEAMRFYAEVLGGKELRLMTFRDSPMAEQIAASEKDMVIHARFTVGDFTIMGSDAPGGRYNKPRGYAVSIGVDTPEEAERIFKALSEGGSVGMPIAETFWAKRFGMVTDRFGTPWMVNCEKPGDEARVSHCVPHRSRQSRRSESVGGQNRGMDPPEPPFRWGD